MADVVGAPAGAEVVVAGGELADVEAAGRGVQEGEVAYDGTPGAGSLYRTDPDGTVVRVLDGLTIVNGPAFTADGTTFYLADSAADTIHRWRVDPVSRRVGAVAGAARWWPAACRFFGRQPGQRLDDERFGEQLQGADDGEDPGEHEGGPGQRQQKKPQGTRMNSSPPSRRSVLGWGGGALAALPALTSCAQTAGAVRTTQQAPARPGQKVNLVFWTWVPMQKTVDLTLR
ncbi:SMP-30/gluconolactonase/LRE family protein [Streptomyces acidicola]|uniref:SMP-30/gluconolactonase/LRE family protein n=1 Tax=Streptomyces acidicola TaxID=2596892 RepID=UPI00381C4AAD